MAGCNAVAVRSSCPSDVHFGRCGRARTRLFVDHRCVDVFIRVLNFRGRSQVVGGHLSVPWPYTQNWAKSRGWALFCKSTVQFNIISVVLLLQKYNIQIAHLFYVTKIKKKIPQQKFDEGAH